MTFSVCLHCRKTDSSYRFDTCDCLSRDDDQEVTDSGYTGA